MPRKEKYEYAVVTISTDDTVHIIGHHDYHLTLDNLYEYTKCDTIQIVRFDTYAADPDVCMCIDDNGKLLHKPVNLIGTLLYGQYPRDFIVGDICIGTTFSPNPFDEPDMFAMDYALAEKLAQFLNSLKR